MEFYLSQMSFMADIVDVFVLFNLNFLQLSQIFIVQVVLYNGIVSLP